MNINNVVDLGELQYDLTAATEELKDAQEAKLKADQRYTEAVESHERSKVALNSAVYALQSATKVPNPYA